MVKIYFGEANITKSKIIIPVYIDTEGESVNAFDIKIKFSNNLIFRDFQEAGSIINFWIEKPNIQNNYLQFSGISIGGYIGKKGHLVNLIFEIKGDNALIEISPLSKVLLNDSLGTEAKLKTETKFLNISKLKLQEFIDDKFPPENFQIYLNREKEIFNGKYYIVFQTSDKQTGIAYYEVAEKQSFIKPDIKDLKFQKAESPYILKDQTLRSYIFVKAIDKVGNERIEYLKPKNLLSFDEIFNLLILMIFIFLMVKLIKDKWKSKILR